MEDQKSKTKKWPQFLAGIFVSIGALGTGTIIAWSANTSAEVERGHLNRVIPDMKLVASLMCVGCMCVCMPVGIIADWIGRKITCLSTAIPFSLGWALIIFCQSPIMIYIGRFVTGIGGGAFCVIGPLYTSEIAESSIRGTLGAFFQLFVTTGILYAQVFGYIVQVKIASYACAAVPVVFFCLFITQPETPLYLLKRNKEEQAIKSLQKFRGKDYDTAKEIAAIKADLANRESLKKDFWPALKSKAGKKSSLICFMLMFYQQLSGINAVMFYSSKIFEAANSSVDFKIGTIIIGAVQICATVCSTFTIDVLGRKVLLMVSSGAMAVSTLLLGVYFIQSEATQDKIGWLPLMSLIIFIIAFSFGLGPVPWVASSELFPTAIKPTLSSAAGTFNWFLAFLVTVGYEPVSKGLGNYTTFFIFTVVSATCVPFTYFLIPETKGKSMEEIQSQLNG